MTQTYPLAKLTTVAVETASTAYKQAMLRDPCAYCGEPAIVLDHIHPKRRGGTRHWHNCAGLCGACNARKSDTPLLRFMARERWQSQGLTHDELEVHAMVDTMFYVAGEEGIKEFVRAYDLAIHRAFVGRR